MRKIISLLAIMTLTVVILFGCNPPQKVETDDYEANVIIDRNVSGELRILIPASTYEQNMIDSAISGFKMLFPNVTVRTSTFQYNNYNATLMQLQSSNSLPDIIWTNTPDFAFLVGKGMILNLDKYINLSIDEGLFDINDFYEDYFDMGKIKGKQYVIPRSMDTIVTFINTEILTEAGVDLSPETTVVKNGWTWDDFLSVCDKVREHFDSQEKLDSYVIDQNVITWDSLIYPWLLSCNANLFDDNNNVIVNSEETAEALNMLKYLVDNRYVAPSKVTAGSSYESGGSAMLFQSAAISHYADRSVLQGKCDIVSFPLMDKYDNAKIGAGIAGYTINARSNVQTRDIAWQFLLYMLSQEGQNALAEGGLNLPSIRKDLADYEVAAWGSGYSDYNLSAYLYAPERKVAVDFVHKFDPELKTDLIQALIDMFEEVSNGLEIQEAITNCENALLEIIDK